jgi:hypothetical protein
MTNQSYGKESEDMLSEYDFDQSKAKPNRFAGRMSFAGRISKERVVVLLDPEVSQVFTTPESVNTVLRALVTALPEKNKKKRKA